MEPEFLSFSGALCVLKDGGKVSRDGWNRKGIFIQLQRPDENSKMKQPYIYITPCDNWVVPWVPGQTDLMSNDWFIVE